MDIRSLTDTLGRRGVTGNCRYALKAPDFMRVSPLAEFTDAGKVAPSFSTWLIDGARPSLLGRLLKGREWMAQPEMVD